MTDERKTTFLAELADGQSVTAAARKTGLSRTIFYRMRNEDPDFAAEWDDAIQQGIDSLEDEASKRAKNGSDLLLIFLLKGKRPEVYKDRQELTGKDSGPLHIVLKGVSTDDL